MTEVRDVFQKENHGFPHMTMNDSDKNLLLQQLLEQVKTLPPGSRESTSSLLSQLESYDNGKWHGKEIDTGDLFDLHDALEKEARRAGLYFDSSSHWGLIEGLPFNLDFIITPLKKNIVFDRIYYESRCFDPEEILDMDLKLRRIFYKNSDNPENSVPVIYERKIMSKIIACVKDCNFSQWEDQYINEQAAGITWQLSLFRKGKTVKTIHGCHAFPPAWRIWEILKNYCRMLTDRTVYVMKKPHHCLFCNGGNIKPYFYRTPTNEIMQSGQYIIGDRNIPESERIRWGCAACGAKYLEGSYFFFLEFKGDTLFKKSG